MPDLTILQIDNMIYALKQNGLYDPRWTLVEAYIAWKSLNK